MFKMRALIVIALSFGLFGLVNAQNLDMSGSSGADTFDQAGKPTRGMTQERVQSSFGSPQSKVAAVGEPPISRWEYAGFVVFFEHDRVIHTVTKR